MTKTIIENSTLNERVTVSESRMKDVYGYVGDLRNTDQMLREYVDQIVNDVKDELVNT